MKKRVISVLLATAMLISLGSVAMAAPVTVKDAIAEYGNALGKDTLTWLNRSVDVPVKVEVKEETGNYVSGPLSIREKNEGNIPTFDYKSTLSMSVVKEAFNDYVAAAKFAINQCTGDKTAILASLENVRVIGNFMVSVEIPSEDFEVPTQYITAAPSEMYGFNDDAKKIFHETRREKVGDTLNIYLSVGGTETADPNFATKTELESALENDLIFTCEGVQPTKFGTYQVKGDFIGSTTILNEGSIVSIDSDRFENPSNSNDVIATIEYLVDPQPEIGYIGAKEVPAATIKISKKSSAIGPGGGTTVETVRAEFVVDGLTIKTVSGESPLEVDIDAVKPAEKDGYIFAGWYGDAAMTKKISGKTTIKANTKYYGEWISLEDATKVEFMVDGKTSSTEYGKAPFEINVDDIEAPTKDGYKFGGWYLDEECTKKVEGTMTIEKDTTLYAKWIPTGALNTGDHFAYITGYTDGTVKPEANIVREEVAAIFYRLLTNEAGKYLESNDVIYSDVPATKWSVGAIATLSKGNYLTGYTDGTFRPNNSITRGEFAAVAARFADSDSNAANAFTDMNGHWAEKYVAACVANGWITGYEDGTFKPDQNITRAEAMAIVNRMLGRAVDKDGIANVAGQIKNFPDNNENAWYYYIVIEATNSHDYSIAEGAKTETWTKVDEIAHLSVSED